MFQYCGVSYHRLWNYPPQRTTMAPAGGLNLTWPLPLFCLKCLHWQFDFEGSKQTTRHSVCVLQTFPSFDTVKIKLQSQTLQKLFMLYQTENAFWGNFRISKWYMKKINWSSHIFHWFVYFFISHGLRTVSFTKSWVTKPQHSHPFRFCWLYYCIHAMIILHLFLEIFKIFFSSFEYYTNVFAVLNIILTYHSGSHVA